MNITSAQIQGPREYQEDAMVQYHAKDGSYLFAIFDGHGGAACAIKAMESVAELYEEYRDVYENNDENLLEEVFYKLNHLTDYMGSGSTASIVLIDKDFTTATVGILGDSPVYISGQTENFISPEHNVRTNEKEAQAVRDRGGFVANGYAFQNRYGMGLQMSRALGDVNLSSILSREPEIFTVNLDHTSYVLLGSDGLFDPSHAGNGLPDDLREVLDLTTTGAQQLVNIRQFDAQDNVSAIVVRA